MRTLRSVDAIGSERVDPATAPVRGSVRIRFKGASGVRTGKSKKQKENPKTANWAGSPSWTRFELWPAQPSRPSALGRRCQCRTSSISTVGQHRASEPRATRPRITPAFAAVARATSTPPCARRFTRLPSRRQPTCLPTLMCAGLRTKEFTAAPTPLALHPGCRSFVCAPFSGKPHIGSFAPKAKNRSFSAGTSSRVPVSKRNASWAFFAICRADSFDLFGIRERSPQLRGCVGKALRPELESRLQRMYGRSRHA